MRNAIFIVMLAETRAIVGCYSSETNAILAEDGITALTTIEKYPLDDAPDGMPAPPPKQTLYKTARYRDQWWAIVGLDRDENDEYFYTLSRSHETRNGMVVNLDGPVIVRDVPGAEIENFCL